MANNFQQQADNWYNQRLNQIASMMSMQNSSPDYLAGALIGDILRTPFQEWIDNKVAPTIMGKKSTTSPEKQQQAADIMASSPLAQNTQDAITTATPDQLQNAQNNIKAGMYQAPQLDTANAIIASPNNNQEMNLATIGQNAPTAQQTAQNMANAAAQTVQTPPTQAQVNAANNNITDKAVTQVAQDGGNMNGLLGNLAVSLGSNAISAATGMPSFSSARSSNDSTEAGYNGRTIEQMLYQRIIDSKNKYDAAKAQGDEQGMKDAEAEADNTRYLAKVYQIPLIGVGSGSTLEQAQQQMDKLQNDGKTTEDDVRNDLRQGILSSKEAYGIAQQQGDQAGMERAQNTAEAIRQMAAANGIDLPEGGSDVTADDLTLLIQRDEAKRAQAAEQKEADRLNNLTPQDLIQRPEINISPNAFYQRSYQENISNGIPEYRARRKAADAAMQYESNYMRDLSRVLDSTGINPDGSLNPAGTALLNRAILAGNPEIAQFYANQFASPREQWGLNADFQKAAVQNQYNRMLQAQKAKAASVLQDQKYKQNWELNKQKAGLTLQTKSALAQLEHKLKGQDEQVKYQIRAQMAQNLGLNPNSSDVRRYILTGNMGGGSSGRSGGGGSSSGGDSTKIPSWVAGLNEGFAKAKSSLDGNDIDDYKVKVAGRLAEMTPDQQDYFNSTIYALNFLREKQAGYEDTAAQYYSAIPEYLRETLLPGY